MGKFSVLFILLAATSSLSFSAVISEEFLFWFETMAGDDWWETAKFYQIYPRSFKDSNGDGVGDLNGITEKLPYLKSLGIQAAWLSPIFKSPMVDFGYDISDFYSIQPEYGTMEDFERLLASANKLGIKIILDFVPNHSSDQNEWFKKSAKKEPGFEDFYVWHPGYPDPNNSSKRLPPSNWVSVFRGSAWTWNDDRQEFYYHAFAIQQPDLNYRSPKVVEEMKSVLRFWLGKGVDGFRVDAVPFLFEVLPDALGRYPDEPLSGNTDDPLDFGYLDHIYTQSLDETFDMVYQWREVLDSFKKERGGDTRVMLTEHYVDIDLTMRFYGDGKGREGSHIPMNFFLIENLNRDSSALDYKNQIDLWMTHMPEGRTANWVMGNHDQRRISSRFGPLLVDGINLILAGLPGACITYNGEEIGMKDVWISWEDTKDPAACNTDPETYDAHSRDPARTPFQWDNSTSAGFSTNPETWLPVSPEYDILNVKLQEQQEWSHLNFFKYLVKMRQDEVLKHGNLVTETDKNLLILYRALSDMNYILIVIVNISPELEIADLTQIKNMPTTNLKYVAVTDKSEYKVGTQVNPESMILGPYDGVMLRHELTSEMGDYLKYEVEKVYSVVFAK